VSGATAVRPGPRNVGQSAAGATADPAIVHMVWALLNHNDFVTLR
jgi:hypothetical protein